MAHRPLDHTQNQIRLLKLFVDDDPNKSVRCTTTNVNLDCAPIYKALTYPHGTPTLDRGSLAQYDRKSLILNDERIWVSRNLDTALRTVYKHVKDALWVDVLCISQKDDLEKSHQVNLMSRIYGEAEEVLACFGEPTGSLKWMNGALAFMQLWANVNLNLDQESENQKLVGQLSLWKKQSWDQIQNLFELPFWNRRWILQELVLARKASFVFGNKKVSLPDFEKAVDTWQRLHYSNVVNSIKGSSVRNRPAALALKKFQLFSLLRSWKSIYGQHPSLTTLLELCQSMEVSDPRDKVFALLAISEKGKTVADYTKSTTEVFTDFAGQLMDSSDDLAILQKSGIMDFNPEERYHLPSWVPTWDTGDCLQLPKLYTASKDMKVNSYFGEDELLGKQNYSRFFATGIKCGKVLEVDAADVMIDNPAQILGQHFAQYKLHTRYPTGIPVLQAIFRTMLVDKNPETQDRFTPEHYKFFDLAAGFLFMLQLMDQIKSEKGESLYETVMTHDISTDPDATLPDYVDSFLKYTRQEPSNRQPQEILSPFLGTSTNGPSPLNLPKEPHLTRGNTNLRHFLTESSRHLHARSMFQLTQGYFGIGPVGTQSGDIVCVLWGCNTPVILRKMDDHFVLVGPCFVLGFMDGEAAGMVRDKSRRERVFNLR